LLFIVQRGKTRTAGWQFDRTSGQRDWPAPYRF